MLTVLALLALPVAAQQTSISEAIRGRGPAPSGEWVHYVPGDTATRGYLAVPDGEGPFPALLIVHQWDGVVERLQQVADGFAAEGYVTLAVDLFRGRVGRNPDENMALVREAQADPDWIIANLDEAQRFVRARDDVTGRIGVMGWCFGGGIALSYGIGGAQHDLTAIFYGSLVTDPELLARINHPVWGTFVRDDPGIPLDQVRQFARTLDSLGVASDVHVYDDVRHGFWLFTDRTQANDGPATDAWRRLEGFLEEHLH